MSLGVFASGLSGGAVALLLGLGVLSLFLGVALIAPRLVKPLASLVGWPAPPHRRLGRAPGELELGAQPVAHRGHGRGADGRPHPCHGGRRARQRPARLGQRRCRKQLQSADYVLAGQDGETFAAKADESLSETAGVKLASGVRSGEALIGGDEGIIAGVDPATIGHFYNFEWTEGSSDTLAQLDGEGTIISDRTPTTRSSRSAAGSRSRRPSGDKRALVVRGIHDPPQIDSLLGDVVIGQQAFDAAYEAPKNSMTFVDAESGADQATIEKAAAGFPGADLSTEAKFGKDRTKSFATFLSMIYVLLAFSVIVSLFGMVNTLVLSVFERTRELGMLRAIGMTRRQARRMIRQESVITALIGAALGLPLGVFLAALMTQALSDYGVVLSIPLGMLGRLHGRRHPGRHRSGDPARPARLAAERPQRAALRVMTATLAPPAPPRTRRGLRGRLAGLERPLLAGGLALVALHLLDLAVSGPDTAVLGVLAIVAAPLALVRAPSRT